MIRFEEPVFLWGCLVALAIFPYLKYYRKTQIERFSRFADPELLPAYASSASKKHTLNSFLVSLVFFLLSIALANPQWSTTKTVLNNAKSDIFVVMDVSRSMTAEDIRPSRLDKSKQFVYRLLEQMQSNRIGLILFAGRAYLQMPLTEDFGALNTFIGGADPDMIPTQGTAIGASIELALRMFPQDDQSGKMIIVVSDGEDHDEGAVEAASKALESGAEVFTIGVGTAEGGTMPVYNVGIKDFKKDENGEPIVTKLNSAALKEVAKAGGGSYFNVSNGETALRSIKNAGTNDAKGSFKKHRFTDFESYFQWFLIPAVLILMFLFFQGKSIKLNYFKKTFGLLFTIAIVLIVQVNILAQESMNQARNADKLYKKGQYAIAEQKYDAAIKKEPTNYPLVYNKSNAQYQQKNYAEAEKGYEKVINSKAEMDVKSKAFYNLGNAYFNQEKYNEAINAYKKSLKINPSDVEAKKNLSIALKKRKKQDQDKDQKENQNQEKQKENNKNKDQKENQNQEKQQKLSKEEAERLLRIIDNEEKNVVKKLPKQRAEDNVNEKDW